MVATGVELRTVLWRALAPPGAEVCRLLRVAGGWQLEGTILTAFDRVPAEILYGVHVDESWNTVAVRVTVSKTGLSGSLTRDGDRWLSRGEEMTTLAGCSDAALAVSPSTFTLPIRRLKLAVGESAEVEAAALAFPTLDLDPVVQRYTRLHDRVWRVEPVIGADPVDIEVDDAGMVVSYPERWRREATSTLG